MIMTFPYICVLVLQFARVHNAWFYFITTPALGARQGRFYSCLQIRKLALSLPGFFPSASQEEPLQQEVFRCDQGPPGTSPRAWDQPTPAQVAPKFLIFNLPGPHFPDSSPRNDLPEVTFKAFFLHSPLFQGPPNLQARMPDGLRWSWCNDDRNKVNNKCNELESSPKPCAKVVFHETGPWCRKGWEPLFCLTKRWVAASCLTAKEEKWRFYPPHLSDSWYPFTSWRCSDFLSVSVFPTVSPELAASLRKLFSCFSDFRGRA